MSVKRLLLTLLAFPIFGILLVSSLGLINTLDQLQQAKFAQASVEVAVPVGDLIHELQVERGLSAGFIASKGANFSDQLPRHRLRVNEVVETARMQLEEKRGIYPDEVVKLEKAVQAALLLRSQIDGLTISVPNMAASYTAAINSAIHLNETMLAHFTDGGLARSGAAWIAITEAKEAAGLERAMGATGFGAGEFSPTVLNNFIRFQSVQLASIKIFKQYADAVGIEADPLQQAENTALFEFRDIAKSGDVNQIQRVAAGDWFSRSTEWVERLRVFENQIAIAVVSYSKASTAQVGFNVAVYVGAALLAVLASAFGFWLIARRLLRGFGNLQQAMASLAKKDFEAEIASKSKVLEVDGLATSLTSMRDELALADSKLVAAFSKSFAFDDSNSAMMIVGPDLKLISLNTEARKLLSDNADDFESRIHGLNAHDAIDCSLAGLLGSENQMMDKFSNKALLPWTGDVAIGALKLEVNVSYVESENGEFAGNVIEARDVTLARLHAGMIASIDQNTCVMEFSLAGEVLGANTNTEILVGANAQDLTGKQLYDLLHKDYDDLGALKEKWSKLAAGEGFTAELRLHHFSSGEAWLRANFTPVKDGQGDVFKISVIAEDTTIAVLADQTRKAEKAKQDSEREVVVTNLANGLKALARGNLGYRIETPFSAEFKSLRMDFNDAISEMSGAILEVSESATKLKLNSQELSGSSVDLAVRTEKQAKNLSEAATALDQLAATAKQTVIRAKEADGVVDQVMTDASQKEGIVKEAIGVMELISKSSQEIEAFSAMIDDISFQTNLLALNAGVEAARAGEAGRGFAVVASEVRALAQRSAEAASEINALLNTSSEKVQKGVSLVNSVGTGLIEISHQIRTIHDQVSGIRNATSDQAKVLGVVNASVSEIEGITQMNAAMGEESSALSTTLERDAEQLFLSVSKFAAEENRTQDAA